MDTKEKFKILLVDDEKDLCEIIKLRIESWGYEVFIAQSAKDSLYLLEVKNPDVIILDFLLPDMNGIELLKEIRNINKKVKVIMFTAHPDIEVIKRTEELGVDSFIPKLSTYGDAANNLKTALDLIKRKLNK